MSSILWYVVRLIIPIMTYNEPRTAHAKPMRVARTPTALIMDGSSGMRKKYATTPRMHVKKKYMAATRNALLLLSLNYATLHYFHLVRSLFICCD